MRQDVDAEPEAAPAQEHTQAQPGIVNRENVEVIQSFKNLMIVMQRSNVKKIKDNCFRVDRF